jgi:hypothetical protein
MVSSPVRRVHRVALSLVIVCSFSIIIIAGHRLSRVAHASTITRSQ